MSPLWRWNRDLSFPAGESPRARPLVACLLCAAGLLSAACDGSVLDTEDPDVTTPGQLEGPGAVPILTAGVINDFREAYDGQVLYTGLFTDEFVLAGTFPTRREVDERDILKSNATLNTALYETTHTARLTADEALELFAGALGDPAFEGAEGLLARGLAVASFYAGYSRILLAEAWCQSILGGPDGEAGPLPSDDRMEEALALLQDAEGAAVDAGRSDFELAARIGQARALLWLGRYAEASQVAATVPTDFVFRAEYSDNTLPEENEVFQFTWGEGEALRWTVGNGVIPQRHDEKYAYYDEWVSLGLIIPPDENDLEPFGGTGVPVSPQTVYSATSPGGGRGADIVLASGWEARMIEAENALRAGDAGGAEAIVNPLLADPAASPLRQVNPGVPEAAFAPVDFTGDLATDLAELARARQAGLWLTGERIATSRRYLDDGVDLFPQGTRGTQIAMPVLEQELNNNPNIDSQCPAGFPGVNP